jgi:hypothetical protein
MTTQKTPAEVTSLVIEAAANMGLEHEFISTMLMYLVEHSSEDLVDQAINVAVREWDL